MNTYLEATARKWHCIAYSKEVVDALCKVATRWAYILHDADLKEDGTPKGNHYHVYLYFKNERKGNGLVALAKRSAATDNNLIVAVQNDSADAIEYFTHESADAKADGKTLYPASAIVYDAKGKDEHFLHYEELQRLRKENRKAKLKEKREERQESVDEFICDLILHGENSYYMARRYGTDFIKNRTHYLQFRSTLLETPISDLEELPETALDFVVEYQRQSARRDATTKINGYMIFKLDKSVADMFEIICDLENRRLELLNMRPVPVGCLTSVVHDIVELRTSLANYLPAIGKTPEYNNDEYFKACLQYFHPEVFYNVYDCVPEQYCDNLQ